MKLYLVKYGTKYICMETLYDFLSKEAEGIFDMGIIVNRDEKDFIDIYIVTISFFITNKIFLSLLLNSKKRTSLIHKNLLL